MVKMLKLLFQINDMKVFLLLILALFSACSSLDTNEVVSKENTDLYVLTSNLLDINNRNTYIEKRVDSLKNFKELEEVANSYIKHIESDFLMPHRGISVSKS